MNGELIGNVTRALKAARWKVEGLYNLSAAGTGPGTTNGQMVICVSIIEEIDRAMSLLSRGDRRRCTGLSGKVNDEGNSNFGFHPETETKNNVM